MAQDQCPNPITKKALTNFDKKANYPSNIAGISKLVLTFSDNLSNDALRVHQKSETLDAHNVVLINKIQIKNIKKSNSITCTSKTDQT